MQYRFAVNFETLVTSPRLICGGSRDLEQSRPDLCTMFSTIFTSSPWSLNTQVRCGRTMQNVHFYVFIQMHWSNQKRNKTLIKFKIPFSFCLMKKIKLYNQCYYLTTLTYSTLVPFVLGTYKPFWTDFIKNELSALFNYALYLRKKLRIKKNIHIFFAHSLRSPMKEKLMHYIWCDMMQKKLTKGLVFSP